MSLTPQEIGARVERLRAQGTGDVHGAVTELIALYREAGSGIGAYEDAKAAIKDILNEVIVETGQESWVTPAGKAGLTSPGSSVSYDTKRAERLLADWAQHAPEFARELARCRVEKEKPGTLRITG